MSKITMDPRLAALYNEYCANGREYDFLWMLYMILTAATQEIREKVRHAWAAMRRKLGAPKRKADKERWKSYVGGMSVEELIKFQNTPYEDLPEWIKQLNPKIVQHPERNNYARIYGLVDMKEHQQEISASRVTRTMERLHFIFTDERGVHLDYKRFSEVCNEIGAMFDQKWKNGLKGQQTRISPRDIENYVESRVTPKGDKMALLATATNLPVWYLAGYCKPSDPGYCDDPLVRYHKGA